MAGTIVEHTTVELNEHEYEESMIGNEDDMEIDATQVLPSPITYSRKQNKALIMNSPVNFMVNHDADGDLLFDKDELLNDVALTSPFNDASILDKSGYTEAESPSEYPVDSKEIESAIRSLMTDDSVSWSMKQWYTEIEHILHHDISAHTNLKKLIKSLVFNEGEYYMSQTQTQPDDIFGDEEEDDDDDPELLLKSQTAANLMQDNDSDYDDDAQVIKSKSLKMKMRDRADSMSDVSSISFDGDDEKQEEVSNKKSKKSKRKAGYDGDAVEQRSKEIVNQEVEAVKQLERGPTEADLRRIEATEIDDDDLQERVERFQKIALHSLASSSGISITQQKKLLRESHDFLHEQLSKKDEKLQKKIAHMLGVEITRIYKMGEDALVLKKRNTLLSYLDDELDDEVDDDAMMKDKTASIAVNDVVVAEVEDSQDRIYLTDSESEEDDEEEEEKDVVVSTEKVNHPVITDDIINVKASIMPVQAPHIIIASTSSDKHVSSSDMNQHHVKKTVSIIADKRQLKQEFERRRREMLFRSKTHAPHHQRNAPSQRSSMLMALNQRVRERAYENHCIIEKIKQENFPLRMEIAERCRQLVEMYKLEEERELIKAAKIRDHRRQELRTRFALHARDGEDEFDDNYDATYGKEIDEEEQLAIIRRAQEDDDEDDEEYVEDEEEKDDDDDEKEVDDEASTDAPSAIDDEASDDDDDDDPITSDEHIVSKVDDIDDDHDDAGDHEDGAMVRKPAPVLRTFGRKLSRVIDDDDHHKRSTPEDDDDVNHDMIASTQVDKDDEIVDSDDDDKVDDKEVEDEEEEESVPAVVKRNNKPPKIKNTLYRMQLLEEERRHRSEKSRQSSLLELEAEEEEEEGVQAGLGDFGFRYSKKDLDDEAEALKLREGDLDHIVDDNDDDIGDEEAGLRARLEMQALEEKKQTKAIITAITEGHDQLKRMQENKHALSFDDLVHDQDEVNARKRQHGDHHQHDDEEYDEEEMLLQGFQRRRDRDMKSTSAILGEFDDEDDEYNDDEMDQEQLEAQLAVMNEEERRKEIESIQRRREKAKASVLKRKQFEEHTRMRRALRRAQSLQAHSSSSQLSSSLSSSSQHLSSLLLQPAVSLSFDVPLPSSSSLMPPPNPTASSDSLTSLHKKRRTSLPPKHYEGKPMRASTMMPLSNDHQPLLPPSTSAAMLASNPSAPKRISSAYKGTIDSAELLGGYGMGMAVTSMNARRTLTSSSSNSNISGIINTSASQSQSQGDKLKRSFSSISRKHSVNSNSNTGVTLTSASSSSQHFVFLGDDSAASAAVNTSSLHRNATLPSSQHPSSQHQPSASSSLFNKLNARSTTLKRTSTIVPGAK